MMPIDLRFFIAVLCQNEDDGSDQTGTETEGTETEGTGDTDPVGDEDTQTSGETMNKK